MRTDAPAVLRGLELSVFFVAISFQRLRAPFAG